MDLPIEIVSGLIQDCLKYQMDNFGLRFQTYKKWCSFSLLESKKDQFLFWHRSELLAFHRLKLVKQNEHYVSCSFCVAVYISKPMGLEGFHTGLKGTDAKI